MWTGVTIIFILFGYFYAQATALAILISTLTAVVWYVFGNVNGRSTVFSAEGQPLENTDQ